MTTQTEQTKQIGNTKRLLQYDVVNGPQTWAFIAAYFRERYQEAEEIPFEVQQVRGGMVEELKVRIHMSGRRSTNGWVFVGAADFPQGAHSSVTKFFKITYTFKSPREGIMQELSEKQRHDIFEFFWR